MKKIARFFIPLAVLLIFAVAGMAQTQYRFEVYGAGSIPTDKDFVITVPQSSTPIQGKQKFSMGGRGGVRFGADGKGHWGQDFIYSYGTNATKITTPAGELSFTSRTHMFAYNGLWYPVGAGDGKKGGTFPYLTAGVGGTFHSLTQKTVNQGLETGLGTLRTENVFAFNAGGGVRVRINSVWGIRIDARDYMSRAVRYGLPKTSTDPSATVFPAGGVFHQIEISFAFVYYF